MGLMQLFSWRKGNLRLVGYFKNQLEIRKKIFYTLDAMKKVIREAIRLVF